MHRNCTLVQQWQNHVGVSLSGSGGIDSNRMQQIKRFSWNQIIYVEVCIYAGERKKSDSSPWIPDVCDTMTRKELSFHSYSVKMVYAPRLKGRLLVYCFVWTLAYARSKTKWQLKTHKWAHIFCYKYRLTVVYCRVSAAESTILTRHSKFKRA